MVKVRNLNASQNQANRPAEPIFSTRIQYEDSPAVQFSCANQRASLNLERSVSGVFQIC